MAAPPPFFHLLKYMARSSLIMHLELFLVETGLNWQIAKKLEVKYMARSRNVSKGGRHGGRGPTLRGKTRLN